MTNFDLLDMVNQYLFEIGDNQLYETLEDLAWDMKVDIDDLTCDEESDFYYLHSFDHTVEGVDVQGLHDIFIEIPQHWKRAYFEEHDLLEEAEKLEFPENEYVVCLTGNSEYPYNVQIFHDGIYSGEGRFCKTTPEVEKYTSVNPTWMTYWKE